MKGQNHKATKSFEDQLKDFMKQSEDIQKDIARHNKNGERRRYKKVSAPRREDI